MENQKNHQNGKLVTIGEKKDEEFLRNPVPETNFSEMNQKELRHTIQTMRKIMEKANGIGLSANQVGLSLRLFVAQLPSIEGRNKFYAILNPKITKTSKEQKTSEEGCLSVPEVFGPVERAHEVTLEGETPHGKKIKIKAWGLLARIFQHEVDHLDGKLFTDKCKSPRPISQKDNF